MNGLRITAIRLFTKVRLSFAFPSTHLFLHTRFVVMNKHSCPSSDVPVGKEPRLQLSIPILFEDDQIIVIDKVPNEASVPLKGSKPTHVLPKKRSDEWLDAVRLAASKEAECGYSLIKEQLELVARQHSIPRKEQKFYGFLERSVKITDPGIQKKIWSSINEVDISMHKHAFSTIPEHLVSSADRVEEYCGHKIYHVHRLDMETSGVLMYAKNAESCAELSRQFRDREVKKMYIARVVQSMSPGEQTINIPISADYENRPRQMVDHVNGKESTTIVDVLYHLDGQGKDPSSTVVKLLPITGRTHQLRVHLSAIGHPILGDTLYAPPEVIAMSPGRLCLHAHILQFKHPKTGQIMTVTSNGCDFVPVDSSSGASRELPKSIPPYIATTVGDSSETV